MEECDFGWALRQLKYGKKICRSGWNGKGMWLVLQPRTVDVNLYPDSVYGRNIEGKKITIDAHIDMYTATGTMQPGWLASQADMLADDWEVLDDTNQTTLDLK